MLLRTKMIKDNGKEKNRSQPGNDKVVQLRQKPPVKINALLSRAHRQARNATLFGLAVILASIGACSAWVAKAPIEGAIIGQGEVMVVDKRTTVQHREGGIVAKVHVREGDQVVPGTVLLEIVDRSVDSQLGVVQSGLNAIQIRKARLNAERSLSDSISFSSDQKAGSEIAAIIASERQSFQSNRTMLNTQLQLIDSQKADARAEISGLKREVTQIKSAYDLLNNEIANAERLVAQNYMAKNTLSTLRREAADYRAQLENRRTGINRAQKKINSLNVRKQETRANYVNIASQALTELENEERRLMEQRTPLEDAVVRQNVTARVAGTVLAMESLHPGSVLPPGGRILDIVPSQDQLMIGARIAVSDIDEVHSGQSTDIRFNAFPARQTPVVLGTVNHVSADRLVDESTGQSYFTVEVSVDTASLVAANLPPLHPGMSANVFLKTQKRTVLDYLLNPVITFHEKAMRES